MLKTKIKEIYFEHTVEVYQSICVLFFVTIIALLSILEFKSGVMEGYKATFALLKTRSDEQIREIAILQEHYKYQQQELNQLKYKVISSDNNLRRDIEDLKQQQNPPIKHLKR
jgi:5-bromo-4-chloroindolyl phosphate hydrolysis protein